MILPFNWFRKYFDYKTRIMKISENGLNLIKEFEGFRSAPYLDAVGVPTIGYGATYYPNGKKVTMNDIPISEKQATDLLRNMVVVYENAVDALVVPLINQNQFDALVSFTYNLGKGALKSSTLLKRVNANPNDPDIKNQFNKWVKAGGRTLQGLVKRRAKEANLYFK
jgi:lysozyme